MTSFPSGFIIIALMAGFWGFLIFGALRGNSNKAIIQRAKEEGRHRVVEINGQQYHALRKNVTLLRSKSGKGRAVLVTVGRERDPEMVDGKVQMIHRWIKIRSFTKSGLSKHERWVNAKAWSLEGEQEIEYHIPLK